MLLRVRRGLRNDMTQHPRFTHRKWRPEVWCVFDSRAKQGLWWTGRDSVTSELGEGSTIIKLPF